MAGYRLADRRPIAVHKVEDTFGHASLGKNFSEDDRAQWCNFARRQNRGTTGGERWRKLRCDLVERPVPRRDETAHTNRLPANEGAAHEPLELVGFQNRNHLLE